MKSLKSVRHGSMLVASPYMVEGPFCQTVVLLLEHHDHGALGLILNRPFQMPVLDSQAEMPIQPLSPAARLHLGGPVNGPVLAVHQQREAGDFEVPQGIYITADREGLHDLLESHHPCRVMLGHASWQPGQLDGELDAGLWMRLPVVPELVFGSNDSMWAQAVRRVGRSVVDSLGIRHMPTDPSHN